MQQKRENHGKGRISRSKALYLVPVLIALAAALVLLIRPVQALAYFFAVPTNTVDVYVNEDGTVSLDYYYLFENQPSGEPIEYVDIGMPTQDYEMGSITATVDGQAVRVEDSTEVKGIALNLGSRAIPSGQRGEVRAFIPTVRGMLFKAKQQESEPYASFQFEPNFFGSQYVTGSTYMTVTLHLPPGLTEQEPRYFPANNWPGSNEPDETGLDDKGNVYYRWHAQNANISSRYVFGASFPARLVPASVLMTEVPFRLNFESLCPALLCLGFGGFVVFSIWASITGERKRRLQYLPPKVAVEGNGIKRGLTAVEAAVLMQQPMDKILTMVLFAVVKKSAARVVSRSPMKVEVLNANQEGLHPYEEQFLEAMARPSSGEQRRGLQDMMTKLVNSVSEKMRGFSRKETVDYYDDIMKKAWQQVEQAETPEMKMQSFDEAMDWTMLDRRFDDRTRDVFGPRPVILPNWWGRYDPTYSGGGGGLARSASPSGPAPSTAGNTPPGGINLPSIPGGEFAASMVGGMQSFASNVVGNLTAFTGGVTDKTNPVPKTTYTSSRGGGGGGGGGRSCACACACACAGCACACAGGGR